MPDLHVTQHALERFIERVQPDASEDEARTALTSPAIALAANIGAPYVKLGTGQHVVLRRGAVVSVLPADTYVGTFDRRNDR